MYPIIFSFHSIIRWLLVFGLIGTTIIFAINRKSGKPAFKLGDIFKSATVSFAHIQLILGYYLYFESPMVKYFRANIKEGLAIPEMAFFGLYHVSMMTIAVFVLTIGSSIIKRAQTYELKRKYVLIYFGVVILIIFLAVPWPFSPFISRPYYRSF
ncbi:MAG: hypothetical protein J7604_05195 [Sporocytophaga sp.]|uniref:hypothetical protein n=1 Tax=Sporocytophaga sp. TaxID=2231183 RepID=UPI001B18E7FB|nr:hypothetical protein [Sporocytophaga sp.]MBO9699584.1 hypothetical protein [Sporocytophaga sp.]